MKTCANLRQNLAKLFSKLEMFQKKEVQKIKNSYFTFTNSFPQIMPFKR